MNAQHLAILEGMRAFSYFGDEANAALDAAIAALAAPKEAGDGNGERLLREVMGLSDAVDADTLMSCAYTRIRRLAAPSKEAGDSGLQFTDATIDKLQDVMATHGFVVPVRVISDAFRTTQYALANPPGDQRQEGEYSGTIFYRQCASGGQCVSAKHHDAKVQEVHDHYRALEADSDARAAHLERMVAPVTLTMGYAASPPPEAAAAVGLRAEVARIAGDYLPDSDKDAPLALQEMRNALLAALASPTGVDEAMVTVPRFIAARAIDALEYAAFNIDGSNLTELPHGITESTCSATSALIAARDLRAAIKGATHA